MTAAPAAAAALWQHWSAGLGGMPPGATELRDLPGVGPRFFHAHPAGAVLVYGEPGLGALPETGRPPPRAGLGDAAAVAAAAANLLAGLNAGTVQSTYSSDPTVLAFETAWNAAGGTPSLSGDGLYGGCCNLALASQNGGSAPPALVPNQSDGTFNCANPGPYSLPGGGGGGGGGGCPPGATYDPGSGNCLYPDPGTCAAGTRWDPVQATCVPGTPVPPGGGTPGGSTSSSSVGTIAAVGGGLLVLGIVAVAAIAAVGSHPGAAAAGGKAATARRAPAHARKAPAHRSAHRPAHHAHR